jgi:hypothetical protein
MLRTSLGVSLSDGFCPVARGTMNFDPDYKGFVLIGLTICDASIRMKIAPDGPNRKNLIGPPTLFRHNSGAVTTYVEGGCEFEVRIIWTIKIHKHPHTDARFLPAQKGRLFQRVSFGPGGPITPMLSMWYLKAMVPTGHYPPAKPANWQAA